MSLQTLPLWAASFKCFEEQLGLCKGSILEVKGGQEATGSRWVYTARRNCRNMTAVTDLGWNLTPQSRRSVTDSLILLTSSVCGISEVIAASTDFIAFRTVGQNAGWYNNVLCETLTGYHSFLLLQSVHYSSVITIIANKCTQLYYWFDTITLTL